MPFPVKRNKSHVRHGGYAMCAMLLLILRRRLCGFLNSCSQMRRTRQPSRRSRRFTRRSRALLSANFFNQKARRVTGKVACLGQPCQKQPSTKIITRCFGNTKSGVPGNRRCRRQPLMPACLNSRASFSSVDLFPRPRTRAMICDLVSGTAGHSTRSCFVVARAVRCRSSRPGTCPPRRSTPSSIFRSIAASLRLALVTKAITPSATAHFA